MDNLIDNKIIGIPVIQNKQDFIVSVFSIAQILKFTGYTKRLLINIDENEQPIYNDKVQRELENPRVEKIADFLINDPDATFPTNVVLNIPEQVIEEQTVNDQGFIEITLKEKVFEEVKKEDGDIFITIIDGQHRIRGIEVAIKRLKSHLDSIAQTTRTGPTNEKLTGKREYYQSRLDDLLKIEIVVSFFINKVLEYQAMIFSTINRTQKKVSQSLVYNLFGLDQRDTPQKTALEIALSLNGHNESPFYKRIKLYGGSYAKEASPPLSQATLVRYIINLISENLRESENDRYKERKELFKRSDSSKKFLPFRKYYAKDEDIEIANILFFYYNAVKDIFKNKNGKSYWEFSDNLTKTTNIFHTTVGFDTLLKILIDILQENRNLDSSDFKKTFEEYLIRAEDLDIGNIERYSFNNRGKKYLYLDMSLKIWPPNNNNDSRLKELEELSSKN